MKCPCQSQLELADCCEPIHSDPKNAQTAEQLMRSRYSAFVLKKMDFLQETHDPKTIKKYDIAATKDWAEQAVWQSLEISSTRDGLAGDKAGWVEFTARYSQDGVDQCHTELSEFHFRNGQWFYSSGINPEEVPSSPKQKIGRNDSCPCGSEKKYKKCCG